MKQSKTSFTLLVVLFETILHFGYNPEVYGQDLDSALVKYLDTEFSSRIGRVSVESTGLIVRGVSLEKNAWLCELKPHQDITDMKNFTVAIKVGRGKFERKIKRFVMNDPYDRALSRWALAEKTPDGFRMISHAHYPDDIKARYDLPKELPLTRKGLGGFSANRGNAGDLDELGISSVTVNINLTGLVSLNPGKDRIEHSYNGRSFYFNERNTLLLDSTFRTAARKNIITAAIILIGKPGRGTDSETAKLLIHPDMDTAGIYSMPNFTSKASVELYAAALDFLAFRYSRPDKKYGRLHHWIMHNEIDAGWVWTNMGDKSALVYMDAYIKSMRLCYVIARNYNAHSEVFISLTHHWAWTSEPKFYITKDLIAILDKFTKAEGDFQWALAHHPYPESLYEPKTWLDSKLDWTGNTPLITFKNLEVLDSLIKSPGMLYRSKHKRTLWLSENGTNSKSYSGQDLAEQAAGFAYAWKKMEKLDGIDGFQWHNWYDHRGEGGLRLGLRRFPDDTEEPDGKKPVWFLYKAAGTEDEDKVFDQYKKMIGISDWDEIMFPPRKPGGK